jgi:hypothetical protein
MASKSEAISEIREAMQITVKFGPPSSELERGTSKLRVISEEAFTFCQQLVSIAFPSSVEYIGPSCFSVCTELVTVAFPADSQLVSMSEMAFAGCQVLKPFVLPSLLRFIGILCFSGCNCLADLAFSSLFHLRELWDLPPTWNCLNDIPDSVESLAFTGTMDATFKYTLTFGNESKLKEVKACQGPNEFVRAFLHVSTPSLKIFRSNLEFK